MVNGNAHFTSSLEISAIFFVLNSHFNEQHCYGFSQQIIEKALVLVAFILVLKMLQMTFFYPAVLEYHFINQLLSICNVSSIAQRFVEGMVSDFWKYLLLNI